MPPPPHPSDIKPVICLTGRWSLCLGSNQSYILLGVGRFVSDQTCHISYRKMAALSGIRLFLYLTGRWPLCLRSNLSYILLGDGRFVLNQTCLISDWEMAALSAIKLVLMWSLCVGSKLFFWDVVVFSAITPFTIRLHLPLLEQVEGCSV